MKKQKKIDILVLEIFVDESMKVNFIKLLIN
ncbi:hypothetical protein BG08_1785 [Bacillus thuringiensis serovar kurstaki]|uniref:Uncharacterized protein n=1 Tax=Bacillus cereus ISP2954 TaxID=1053215 RepID=A0A9W5QCV3_BACCE|nr:hypothetical protein BG08_1785 [Bacillus thuringiensis serovar kurstaki]EJV91242.1 hypothetical protein IG1_00850 [Bacillus cereus HD73]EOP19898.1 hypothetical protein IGG_00544 [Bacillus cereus HuB13-1]EOP58746.1 hypothetical protein IGU_01566 [Bacillus cereus ISP2954]EOP98131.1 hypothetical protein IES_01219 [Bacillus cereus BMG1.7]KKB27335.1 hypothetical protein Btm27_05769 [Bacillus thuringiensis serovar mexicanensis]USP54310.1 hypothetical protein J2N67_004559 [Bacillus thuringiensis]